METGLYNLPNKFSMGHQFKETSTNNCHALNNVVISLDSMVHGNTIEQLSGVADQHGGRVIPRQGQGKRQVQIVHVFRLVLTITSML